MKRCNNCFEDKPESEFYPKRAKHPFKDIIYEYKQARCKSCNKDVVRAYQRSRRERERQLAETTA